MAKTEKLGEQVLGFASVKRLHKLAGIRHVDQVDEAKDKKPDADGDGVPDWADKKKGTDKEEVKEDEFDGMDDMDNALDAGPVDSIDPMGDEGIPGELGDAPVEEPFDPEMDDMASGLDAPMDTPMNDPMDEPADDMGMDYDAGLDAPADDMVDMDSGLPEIDPEPAMGMDGMDMPADDLGMDMGMGGSDMVADVRMEMESSLDGLLASAPNLKIADFKDVLHHAEEVVAQIRAMGGQYLKEGRVTKRNANKTLREAANVSRSGFRRTLFDVNTVLSEKWKDGADVKSTGEWANKTIAELQKRAASLRKKETRSAAETKDLREINFAIRSKRGWKGGKGSATK